MNVSNEAKVGGLIAATALLSGLFAFVIGVQNPFAKSTQFFVTYHFAGGIEVGSPVRVSGIKVGKVESIDFFSPIDPSVKIALQEPGSDSLGRNQKVVPLKLKISIKKEAAVGVREDSRFYINMAGIIGERYVEVTPGSQSAPAVSEGQVMAGIDPPRVDQLLSQSFDLAGKIIDLVEENKGDFTRSLELLFKLSGNLNKTLTWVDKSAIFKTDLSQLIQNLISITSHVRKFTEQAETEDGKKTLKLLHALLWRLEPLDSKAIKNFFQKEGVKVKLF